METKMTKTLIWIDDLRSPWGFYNGTNKMWHEVFSPIPMEEVRYLRWVKTYEDFVNFIEEWPHFPDAICFDHDLGEGKSGYDCAKYLVEFCMNHNLPLPKFNIHSMNSVGKENIQSLLNNFNKSNNK